MQKVLLTLVASLACSKIYAITIPSAPSSPSGYDEIRTQEGTACRSSVGGNLQIYGGLIDMEGDYNRRNRDETINETGGFIGVAYSFGGGERLRCDRLAEIETERALLQLQQLKSEIKDLEKIRKLKIYEREGLLPKLSRDNDAIQTSSPTN